MGIEASDPEFQKAFKETQGQIQRTVQEGQPRQ